MQSGATQENKSKFEMLYDQYRSLMFYVADCILHNTQDAEDAVHNAFVYLAENLNKISDPVCPKTKSYIVTIVESKAIDIYRKKTASSSAALGGGIGWILGGVYRFPYHCSLFGKAACPVSGGTAAEIHSRVHKQRNR